MTEEGRGAIVVLVLADDIITYSTTELHNRFSTYQNDISSPSTAESLEDDCESLGSSSTTSDFYQVSDDKESKLTDERFSKINLPPIDVQFTTPGILIIMLYCLAR